MMYENITEGISLWSTNNPFNKGQVLIDCKEGLQALNGVDNVVNWLYINGYKNSARDINKLYTKNAWILV